MLRCYTICCTCAFYNCQTPDSWITVERGVLIRHDLEQYPLQIRTNSLAGDDTLVDLTVYQISATSSGEYLAYIYVKFSDVLQYKVSSCVNDHTPFPTTPPTEQDKTWTITKTSIALKIECNGIEVLEVIYSNYGEACVTVWSNDVAKIMFYPGYDTASDEYKESPRGEMN